MPALRQEGVKRTVWFCATEDISHREHLAKTKSDHF